MREAVGTYRSHGERRARKASMLVWPLLASALLTLLLAASASALSQRGHVFVSSFGSEGSGAGQMKNPQGVAVNEQTGDIYVVDNGNARVDRFDSTGKFISAFGIGVLDGEHTLEVCTTTCRAGLATKGKGNLFGALDIAVDNSTNEADPSRGDVYVEVAPFETKEGTKEIEREAGAIEKFSATGAFLEQINHFKIKFNGQTFTEKIEEPFGLTVDASGNVLLRDEENVITYGSTPPAKQIALVEAETEGSEAHGFAVDAAGHLFVGDAFPREYEFVGGHFRNGATEITEDLPNGELMLETVYDKATSGVAYETGRGDLVLDNGDSLAVLSSEDELVQTLAAPGLTDGRGVAVSAASEHIYAADGSGKVVVFGPEGPGGPTVGGLAATNTTGTAAELSAFVDPHGGKNTKYTFRISTAPLPGAEEACTSPCVEAPLSALGSERYADVATGPFKVEGLVPETRYHYAVWAQNELEPEGGGSELLVAQSAERTFTTPFVVGSTLPDGRAYEKVSPKEKNGSAFMPLQREGAVIQAAASGAALTYVGAGAVPNSEGNPEPEGNQAAYLTQIFGRWHEGGWSARDLDVKHEKGEGLFPGNGNNYILFSRELDLAALETTGAQAKEFPPLTGNAAQERTPYLRENSVECEPSPAPTSCFIPLLSSENAPAGYGGNAVFLGGDAGLRHVVVSSKVALTSTVVPKGVSLYERSAEAPGYQLVSVLPNGEPAAFATLGYKRAMVDHAVSEGGSRVVFTANSAEAGEPKHLYLRDTVLGKTVQIDKQQAGVTVPTALYPLPAAEYEHPFYQDASPDGSIVYFADEWRLTTDSTAQPHKPDLYACVVFTGEGGELECHLHDLTADSASQAGYLQGILGSGSSAGGSTVYFVANGQLATGAQAGKCKPGSASGLKEHEEDAAEDGGELEARPANLLCNLYVEHYDAASQTWTAPKLVSLVSTEDEPDWLSSSQPGVRGNLVGVSSRVAPDGEGLAFMSDRNLTGYDTRDVSNGRPAEEVYYYSNTGEGSLACASCNPGGGRPHGIFDQKESGEGIGLLVDSSEIWGDRMISAIVPGWDNFNIGASLYQNRYLNNQGRLFFNSVEALVPQDKNGKMDVYEYEPVGVGGCTEAAETFHEERHGCVALISSGTATHESAFLDASESGEDVFFMSAAQLVPADKDGGFDVYDAAICGASGPRPCIPAPEGGKPICTEIKTCRPGSEEEPGPIFSSPGSTAPAPNGNTGKHEVLSSVEEKTTTPPAKKPPTRAQKLAKALKSCKKLKSHKKRVSCEKAARKKYGAKKAAKKSAHRSSTIAGRRG